MLDLKRYIRNIPDFPKPGVLFRDITPLLADASAYADAVNRFVAAAPPGITHVAAIEARGFLFAPAVAARLSVGIVPIRKPGKLPCETISAGYALEYGSDSLVMHKDALTAGDCVYLLDDLIATGGSLAAAASLVQAGGARIGKISCLIALAALDGRKRLPPVSFTALVQY